MSYETLLFESEGAVGILTLNRPDKLNSFTQLMHEELAEVLERIQAQAALRALLVTGAGRGFCAGQDLGDAKGDLGSILERYFNPLIRRLRALPMPVIAAVNGIAAGAGANLAFACDIVYAGRSARFIQSFSKIGLIPDAGGSWILPRLVGMARATAVTMLAEPVSAEQAAEWGMIWKCVEDSALLAETKALAAHLATQPTQGFALQKQALAESWSNDLDRQLEVERALQSKAGASDDFHEGVRAFLEKRPAIFQGR